jgi:hypothetical protein
VDTVGKIDFHCALPCLFVSLHLIDIRRAKSFAWVLIFFGALAITDIIIQYLEVGGLFLLMRRARIVDICLLVKGTLPIIFDIPLLFIRGGISPIKGC